MDCIILAGNREDYREVSNENNKAFLTIGNRSILQIMMNELREVAEIDRLLLVGPKRRLEEHLNAEYLGDYPKPVCILEQKNDLVENILAVFDATREGQPEDRYVLILPSDIPLLIAEELRCFINRCDMGRYDYVAGITTEEALSRFYPCQGKAGVVMNYFYCNGRGYRINNMHMVRPSRMMGLKYIRRMYAMRYQKEWINIVKMFFNLVLVLMRSPRAILFYLGVQLVLPLRRLPWKKPAQLLEKRLQIPPLEKHISRILYTRFKIVVTPHGGSTIDVDNESDYQAIRRRFEEWVALQKALKLPRDPLCAR